MQIHVGSGIGTGPTKMAAFDSALNEIGIANFNMLRLSSIVPPNAEMVIHNGKIPFEMPGTWGDRMYVVMAETRVDRHNQDAWAGIGWFQDRKTGRGMFTEHEGNSEAFVRREITQSLEAFKKTREENDPAEWGPIEMVVVGKTCTNSPVCAMVAAVFQISDWDNKAFSLKGKTEALNGTKSRFWTLSRS